MAQFLSRIILHLVFIKKDWQLYLDRSTRALMHAYLARVCRGLNAEAYRFGGVNFP